MCMRRYRLLLEVVEIITSRPRNTLIHYNINLLPHFSKILYWSTVLILWDRAYMIATYNMYSIILIYVV